jgi:hypothetical protein
VCAYVNVVGEGEWEVVGEGEWEVGREYGHA